MLATLTRTMSQSRVSNDLPELSLDIHLQGALFQHDTSMSIIKTKHKHTCMCNDYTSLLGVQQHKHLHYVSGCDGGLGSGWLLLLHHIHSVHTVANH